MTNPDVSEADVAERTCTFDGCDRKHKARGWCDIHYFQWRKTGEVRPIRKWAPRGMLCLVCAAPVLPNSRRRKFCSDGCAQADHRTRGTRPKTTMCAFCKQAFSLEKRTATGRLQRVDTIWCPDCGRSSVEVQRFRRYGVTPEQYAAASEQGCAICGTRERKLHIDHDHACCPAHGGHGPATCGKCVRGFICGPCNRGLGLFFDNATALRRAADYLDPPP